MNQQRTNFINDANRRVADALRHIRRVGELANRDVYRYTNSDVDEIVAALHAEVTRTSAKFMRGSSSPTARFRLSGARSLAPALPKRAEQWKFAYASLLRRRIIANARLRKIRSKPFASDAAADRLLRAIAKALQLPKIPRGIEPSSWALSNPKSVIILDAKRVAQTFNPTLEKAPQSMIKGRLKTIQTFAPEVSAIRVVRAPKGMRLPKTVDTRYAVVLFRAE